jgi:predicted deacylase
MRFVWTIWWLLKQRGNKRRGTEVLRYGARTPTVRLRGHRIGIWHGLNPRPRRWTLGASPHSVGIYSHAPTAHAFYSPIFFCIFGLLMAVAVSAQAAAPARVTTYAQMTAQLKADAEKSPLVRVGTLGKSAAGKRELWIVRLADPNAGPKQALRLLVLCRQHGDEPASTEALLHLIQSIASGGDPLLRSELAHVTLYIVPMVNPDGAGAGTRVNGVGADLNRDWGIFAQPETREVANAAKLIRPALIVDAHNWDGNDEYNADCIEIPREMETRQGRAAHAMQQQAVRDLAVCGYAVNPTAWGDDSNPHLAHRWFVHQNIPSLLVETHSGSPVNRADFERREGMYTALVHSLVQHYAAPWMGKASPETQAQETQEAALFPLPTVSGTIHRVAALPKHSFRWLWAFGLYGLALWGMSLRRPESFARERTEKNAWEERRHSGRYAHYYSSRTLFSRKRDGTEINSHSGHRKAVSRPPR